MIESRLLVRELTPFDAARLTDFIASVPVEDLRQRFHNPSRGKVLAHVEQLLARLGGGEVLAVVAEDEGAIVGLADGHVCGGGAVAEFAVLVTEHCRGRGLGGRLLRRLISAAADAGVTMMVYLELTLRMTRPSRQA